jgi:hypothetical protein
MVLVQAVIERMLTFNLLYRQKKKTLLRRIPGTRPCVWLCFHLLVSSRVNFLYTARLQRAVILAPFFID